MDVFKLLALLPPQIGYPFILFTVFMILAPKIAELIKDVTTWRRSYQREKLDLELLKLKYEVAKLKKEAGLDEVTDALLLPRSPEKTKDVGVREAIPGPTSRSSPFFFGALGGLTPTALLVALVSEARLPGGTLWEYVFWYGIYFVPVSVLGGWLAVTLRRQLETRFACFLVGCSSTLALAMIGHAAIDRIKGSS